MIWTSRIRSRFAAKAGDQKRPGDGFQNRRLRTRSDVLRKLAPSWHLANPRENAIMKRTRDDHSVGYGRPPKHSQWKKGQSGNPNPRSKAQPEGVSEFIDKLFAKLHEVSQNGERRRVSGLEAIFLQLWAKEMAGDARALNVRLQYQAFAFKVSGPGKITVIGGLPDRPIVERIRSGGDNA